MLHGASILTFIVITFIGTFGVEFWLISQGVRFDTDVVQHTPLGWLLVTMWMPGIGALVAAKFVEGLSLSEIKESLMLRLGSIGPYFVMLLLAPVALAAMYGLSWLLGLTTPDWNMSALAQVTGSDDPITPDSVFKLMLPLSIVMGPLIHFVFALGEEIGWRGFLLTRLLPLGKAKAYTIVAILWGVWHAPIIYVGFNYPGNPVAGIAMMCLMTSAFGLFINEMTLHYRSTYLAAFIHAAVNAQGFGIWMWLFPETNPFIGGSTGLTGLAIWLTIGLLTTNILARLKKRE